MADPSAAKPPKENLDSSALGRAAQYVRMSTEHQQYSIENQSAAIALYAAAHNLGVVRSFVDGGKTGVTIKRRLGLQELLRIVEAGMADFVELLVYDVSRWGRFPDNDEGAHYEYLCKRAGVSVHYCAEQFENDNSPTSNLLKALKRTMAAEYSRELSVKVSAGQNRLASMGFWQGGHAPFGMMRQIVDQSRNPKGFPKRGEWKSISTDRIVLKPGPPEAIRTIKLAYDLYTKQGKVRRDIAKVLNERKVFRGSTPWTVQKLRCLFLDPIYKGAYAYGRHDSKLRTYKNVPPERWLLVEHAFPQIISDKQWAQARERIRQEMKPLVDSEMLEGLRRLWKRKGRLNSDLINAAKEIPSVVAYAKHFGGMNETYKLIGYPLSRDLSFVNAIRMSRRYRHTICDDICERVRAIGGSAIRLPIPGMLLLNENVTIRIRVVKGWVRPKLHTKWNLLLGRRAGADIVIVARLKPPSSSILDYFVIPAYSQLLGALQARERDNDAFLEIYRFDDLQPFIESFRRFPLRETV
jgi:DNA invertase Pin-like site-specific DNA recombinase